MSSVHRSGDHGERAGPGLEIYPHDADETAQAADDLRALARCCLGMQDDSFWRNTAGMNRINGWRLPAKEGLGVC